MSQHITEFLSYVTENDLPIDFVSTHLYPTDYSPLRRDIMQNITGMVRAQVNEYDPNMPLLYTEYNSGLYATFNPAQHDTHYAAAFVIANIPKVYGNVDMLSYWTFSDVFEEGGFISTPFHGGNNDGYGMINIQGVPKPAFRAFELLHQSGTTRLNVTYPPINTTVDVLVTTNSSALQILITNWNVFGDPIEEQNVSIIINNIPSNVSTFAILQRIDQDNANPLQAWKDMGSPQYMNPQQVQILMDASVLTQTFVPLKVFSNGTATLSLSMPTQAVAALSISFS